jgi:hypothetical protein
VYGQLAGIEANYCLLYSRARAYRSSRSRDTATATGKRRGKALVVVDVAELWHTQRLNISCAIAVELENNADTVIVTVRIHTAP